MKVEDRKRVFNEALKSKRKELGLGSRLGTYYKKYGDYFFDILISLTGLNEFTIQTRVKPYNSDTLAWTILEMEENLEKPKSLRAVGAFAVRGYPLEEKKVDYYSLEELEEKTIKSITEEVKSTEKFIDKFENEGEFVKYTKENPSVLYDENLGEMLWKVETGQFQSAKEQAENLLEQNKSGYIINNRKSIYEYIKEYSDERIEKKPKSIFDKIFKIFKKNKI